MAKKSRGRVSREPAPAPTTSRAQRSRPRRTVRRTAERPFFERYRSLIIGGIAVAGLLVIGLLFFQGATQANYSCRAQLTPGPSEPIRTPPPATPTPTASPSPSGSATPSGTSPSPSASGSSPSPSASGGSPSPSASGSSPSPSASASASPAPSPTQRLGFSPPDGGAFHVADPGRSIAYDYCPPASGDHYNINGRAPMQAAVYPATQEYAPGFWVHNLEHGYVAALYRCPSGQLGVGECISQAELAQLEQYFADSPEPQLAACAKKALVVRFDEMTSDFAMVAWNRVLLMDEFNLDTALTFADQWMEHVAVPENEAC